jgi:enoyl-CoA hydratase
MKPYDNYLALKFSRAGRILTITMDNPPLNSPTGPIHTDLSRVFFDINRDTETDVVILTGAGERAFSAGGDINAMARRIESGQHDEFVRLTWEAKEIVYGMLRLEKPLIARLNGHTMGTGATIAALADFAFVLEAAKIGDPHVGVGLSAGDGAALIWPMLMGFMNARKYLFTGDQLLGKEAERIGLVTEAVASIEELDAKVNALAERLARGPTRAINGTKISINILLRKMFEGVVETHLGQETFTYLSKDHGEAVRAIREKRDPKFEKGGGGSD